MMTWFMQSLIKKFFLQSKFSNIEIRVKTTSVEGVAEDQALLFKNYKLQPICFVVHTEVFEVCFNVTI